MGPPTFPGHHGATHSSRGVILLNCPPCEGLAVGLAHMWPRWQKKGQLWPPDHRQWHYEYAHHGYPVKDHYHDSKADTLLAADLKLLNLLLGISNHGGTHACLYCTGTLKNATEAGQTRTFATILQQHQAYLDAVKEDHKTKQSQFHNCVRSCLYPITNPEATILSAIPPPQLHIFIGAVNKLFNTLIHGGVKN